MPIVDSFTTKSEDSLTADFIRDGYIIRDVEDRDALDTIRHHVVVFACEYLSAKLPDDETDFLNRIHERMSVAALNEFRMDIYSRINSLPWFRPTYFSLGRSYIETLVGNELAMQHRVNLSIQMPDDSSSLLEIHADTFSGETPFQIVQWTPMVDVYDTKAMFHLTPGPSTKAK